MSLIGAARVLTVLCSLVAWVSPIESASAQGSVPDYDFRWATITHTNNAPFTGFIYQTPNNRGVVGYEYRISKLEVTTAQWVEFFNAVAPLDRELALSLLPISFGAAPDSTFQHVIMSSDPRAPLLPVHGISWRSAARFANWLHNGKVNTLEALSSGAYDTSTFGDVFVNGQRVGFTDNLAHAPDAKFWIPSLDERMKAAFYDPDRFGLNQEGWWTWANSMDRQPVYGLPGEGESSGTLSPSLLIPLGAYATSLSPWGLLDTSGGSSELVSAVGLTWGDVLAMGTGPGVSSPPFFDQTGFAHGESIGGGLAGLRLASAIPAVPCAVPFVALVANIFVRRRRMQ